MKILWIVNIIFPELAEKLEMQKINYGGWMTSIAKGIAEENELIIATVYNGKKIKKIKINNIIYYLLPNSGKKTEIYNCLMEDMWRKIKEQENPDIIHIHGTEYPYGLAYIKANGNENVIVSIQGLISIIAKYYLAGISHSDILKNITIRDVIRKDTIIDQKRKFKRRGEYEKQVIRSVKYAIGRTEWDKAHLKQLNKNIKYFYNNESLREVFYEKSWKLNQIKRNTIYVSQATYPIKGVHMLIKAIKILKDRGKEVVVNIGGYNIMEVSKLRKNGYAKYLQKMMVDLDVEKNIKFLGELSENEVIEKMLESHIAVVPSVIENSSNSIGEAQIIGMPVIASYVGGTPDMIDNLKNGLLYRYEEVEMLANLIEMILEDDKIAIELGENAKKEAALRHKQDKNLELLLEIYWNMKGGKDEKI